MIFKFAFRNVLRNRKRSFLTALTIFFAAIIVGFSQSWVNGLLNVYIENFTRFQTGHVRISTEEFVKREKFMPVDEFISEPQQLIDTITSIDNVNVVRERIRFAILLGKGDLTTDAVGMSIDLENNEFNLKDKILNGTFINSGMYVGYRLAKKLNIVSGDELLLAAKTSEGGLNGIKLKVNGIFKLGMMYDKKYFFVGLDDARTLLKMQNGITEILVYADDIEQTDLVKASIKTILPAGIIAESYKEQLGTYYETLKSTKSIYIFIEGIILFLASFVIINTMMMAIFERMREIGTMKALGMTDSELFLNFTLEGAILGAAGGILGAAVGFLIIVYLSKTGIDMTTQLESLDIPYEYIIRPLIRPVDLVIAVGLSIIVPALAAMIPARHARRLMPAEALRK